MERFKKHLLASGKNIYDIFQNLDKENSGEITALEFKNAIMKLNLGISN